MAKPNYSVRLEEKLVDALKEKGYKLSKVIEASMAKLLRDKKCPYCNQEIKK